jgi:hypothetical protein
LWYLLSVLINESTILEIEKILFTPLTLAFDAVFYSLGGITTLMDKSTEK